MTAIHATSVIAIARKDFQDAVRSWLFWGLSMFFFTVLAVVTAIIWYFAGEPIIAGEATTEVLVSLVSEITRLIIPVIALILGWKAIAGERETGSIKVLLALPHSRADVIVGKLLGRSAVLSLSLVVGFALGAVVVAAFMGRFGIVDYVGLLVMSIIYGIAYVSIAVAISAISRSTTVAGAGVFGVFVLFYVVWNALIQMIEMLVVLGHIDGVSYTIDANGDELTGTRMPGWAYFLERIDPGEAYAHGLTVATSAAEIPMLTAQYEAMFDGSIPFYLQDWFGFAILLFWIIAPLALAIYYFERIDL